MKRKLFFIILSIITLYLILLIPEPKPDIVDSVQPEPFEWKQDKYWDHLESLFIKALDENPEFINNTIELKLGEIDRFIERLQTKNVDVESAVFDSLENSIFELAPYLAVQPEQIKSFIEKCSRIRIIINKQSQDWNLNSRVVRDRIYRLLYGTRLAIEEIILQSAEIKIPTLVIVHEEPSAAPKSEMLGVTIHSGDILVSRGGAPTSALIARGSDYPGNFSHVALVHVSEKDSKVSIIEAHIEIGVAIADIEKYLQDKKLRVMVLRPKSNHPLLLADPMIPHKAATDALNRTTNQHIAYDFKMDYDNPDKLFCSEVASSVYKNYGINLWMGISRISSEGLKRWLADFGVRNFITQEPSDLEYDPQLQVVAEWRDYQTLTDDHLDNAILDVMLEGANAGDILSYEWYMLPIVRVLKTYSWILNQFGAAGPIPEGMSATSALKNEFFSQKHKEIKSQLIESYNNFKEENGYYPPYWEIIRLAREAKSSFK